MKSTIITIIVAVIVGGFLYAHSLVPIIGPFVWMFILWIIYATYVSLSDRQALMQAAERIEPLFVVSLHPQHGYQVTLRPDLDAVCLHVPHPNVIEVARAQINLLHESGNEYMLPKNPFDRLPVEAILFRDGVFVCETWEEFEQRVMQRIVEVRSAWHAKLAQHPEVYNKYHHHQTIPQL